MNLPLDVVQAWVEQMINGQFVKQLDAWLEYHGSQESGPATSNPVTGAARRNRKQVIDCVNDYAE
jgi:hypothetical protein